MTAERWDRLGLSLSAVVGQLAEAMPMALGTTGAREFASEFKAYVQTVPGADACTDEALLTALLVAAQLGLLLNGGPNLGLVCRSPGTPELVFGAAALQKVISARRALCTAAGPVQDLAAAATASGGDVEALAVAIGRAQAVVPAVVPETAQEDPANRVANLRRRCAEVYRLEADNVKGHLLLLRAGSLKTVSELEEISDVKVLEGMLESMKSQARENEA